MSDSYMRHIPVDPRFQPTHDAALSAADLLRSFLPRQTIDGECFDSVRFVDAECNWRAFIVPAAEQTLIPGGRTRCPRPGKQASPHYCLSKRLVYGWPVGFASYILETLNSSSKVCRHLNYQRSSANSAGP
jgi:hypothetical protein